MSFGLPVIFGDSEINKEFNNIIGFSIKFGDLESAILMIKKFFEKNVYNSLSLKCIELIRLKYNWDSQFDEINDLYYFDENITNNSIF